MFLFVFISPVALVIQVFFQNFTNFLNGLITLAAYFFLGFRLGRIYLKNGLSGSRTDSLFFSIQRSSQFFQKNEWREKIAALIPFPYNSKMKNQVLKVVVFCFLVVFVFVCGEKFHWWKSSKVVSALIYWRKQSF